jgi:hypothetical protein
VRRALRVVLAVAATLAVFLGGAIYWFGHRGAVADETAPIATCQGTRLPPDVEALVRPVLMARTGEDWGPDYAAFEQVLASKHPAALEARVLVRKYSQCRPPLSSEWRMPTVVVLRTLYDIYGRHAGTAG